MPEPSELLVALSFDVDNDFCQNPKESNTLLWRGLDVGVGQALSALDELSQELGHALPSSWFVRMDEQVRALTGSTTWAAERFRDRYEARLASQGGGIEWHAHLYRKDEHAWHNELSAAGQDEQLRSAYAAMQSAGFACQLSRIGESLFSNQIATTLQALGVLADSTAMSGRYRENCFDWRGTPDTAFRHHGSDYRRPALEGLLQIPFSMLPVQADYDEQPFRRYLNLGFLHRVMDRPIRQLVTRAPYLVCVGHPFELLPEARHPLWGGSVDNFVRNLRALVDGCRQAGRPLRFIDMRALAGVCAQHTSPLLLPAHARIGVA